MSLNKANRKPVKVFISAIIIGIASLYILCDFYLKSVGRELMLNWVRTESAAIQEGNLLTSATKNQKFILSSDYIRAIKLVKNENNEVQERLQFGKAFSLSIKDIPQMTEEVVVRNFGFLHKRAFYKIPGRDEMFMIFDIESKVLNTVFFIVSAILLLMVISLVAIIRSVEKNEASKREEIFKLALNEFISKDMPSEVIQKELPTLMAWWKDKKDQAALSQQMAVKNQSKILLGEIASRVGHDIVGSVRNIELLFKRATGLNPKQTEILNESINKIKTIASDISKQTKQSLDEQRNEIHKDVSIDLNLFLSKIVEQKQIQFEDQVRISFDTDLEDTTIQNVSSIELERSISNLINNAVEASKAGSDVVVGLSRNENSIQVQIKDSGSGISPENIKKVGTKGFTSNKFNGTGIGVFYAKQFIESLGGKLEIQSNFGQSTVVSLNIPQMLLTGRASIEVKLGQHLLILEDQAVIRESVRLKLNEHKNVNFHIFSTAIDLENWLNSNKVNFVLYSDYFLESEDGQKLETGIEVIKRLGLAEKSVLFTSAFDDIKVRQAAAALGVKVLSKDQFFEAEIIAI